MYASFQASPSLTYIAVESSVPFFWPSHVPLAVPLIVRISTVGEIAVAWPSLTFTLVMPSHFIVSVHRINEAEAGCEVIVKETGVSGLESLPSCLM